MRCSRNTAKPIIFAASVASILFLVIIDKRPKTITASPVKDLLFARKSYRMENGRSSFRRNDSSVSVLANSGRNENVPRRNNTRRRLPQCIIIGVRKGGTRALLEFLKLHPSVKTVQKEVHFFDKNYSLGLDWYRSHMPLSNPHEITIEKTPRYFVTPEAPERVHRMNSSIKLILIVRDPTERSISDFSHSHRREIRAGPLNETFEEHAINADTGRLNLDWSSIGISLYHKHIERWLNYFPRKQILILDSEAFIKNPVPVLRRIESFLNLAPKFGPNMFYFNKTKGFYCRNTPPGGCLGWTKGLPHPEVRPEVIARLRGFFRPHNTVFYKMVGHDFKWP
ncbi:heparan sulfate glucosamine 3-O-sulfotransferase 1-like [Lineus longissimus]|uniref:heparan sulfate glucosamine 3-O-sulfotransferase 1-like n=1 Tax=Lineus longissimus TaxID=88925 RepID=UPI002B4EA44A